MRSVKFLFIAIGYLSCSLAYTQPVKIDWPEYTDYSNYVDTRSRNIELREEKVYEFPSLGIGLRNDFDAARLNRIEKENDSTLVVCITPENYPINMSPWYSFKIWSKQEKDIYLRLKYRQGGHRYIPKLSSDGKSWVQIDDRNYLSEEKDSSALFRLSLSKDTLWVSAQEIMTSSYAEKWMARLSEKKYVNSTLIGKSTQGRPITAMSISDSDEKNMLVILSRQHPPELTGFMEMMSFVECIAGDSKLSKKFRKKFRTIVVPVMNPDGVDNGHWRHNAGGVDLNRDWRHFNQPETYALRKYIKGEIEKNDATLYYGIDFHSTTSDLFYIKKPAQLPTKVVISWKFIKSVNEKMKDNPFSPEDSNREQQTSSNWFINELGVDAITYEVGDNTERTIIKQRGEIAAYALMEILLQESE